MTKLEKLLIPMICKGLTKSDIENTKFIDSYVTDEDKGLLEPHLYLMYKFDPQDRETENVSINLLSSNYTKRFGRVINGIHYNIFVYSMNAETMRQVGATAITMTTDQKMNYINFWGLRDEFVNEILSSVTVRCNSDEKLHSIPPEDYAPTLRDKQNLIIYK